MFRNPGLIAHFLAFARRFEEQKHLSARCKRILHSTASICQNSHARIASMRQPVGLPALQGIRPHQEISGNAKFEIPTDCFGIPNPSYRYDLPNTKDRHPANTRQVRYDTANLPSLFPSRSQSHLDGKRRRVHFDHKWITLKR